MDKCICLNHLEYKHLVMMFHKFYFNDCLLILIIGLYRTPHPWLIDENNAVKFTSLIIQFSSTKLPHLLKDDWTI